MPFFLTLSVPQYSHTILFEIVLPVTVFLSSATKCTQRHMVNMLLSIECSLKFLHILCFDTVFFMF